MFLLENTITNKLNFDKRIQLHYARYTLSLLLIISSYMYVLG